MSKQKHCAPCWNVCSDDRAAGGNAHLDRCRSHGSAARIYGTEWNGADDTSGESVFRTCVCVSWTAGRSNQDACSERFENFIITVSGGGMKRVRLTFREKDDSRAYASFALPQEKMQQIAHAILAVCGGVEQPIETSFQEAKLKSVAA